MSDLSGSTGVERFLLRIRKKSFSAMAADRLLVSGNLKGSVIKYFAVKSSMSFKE